MNRLLLFLLLAGCLASCKRSDDDPVNPPGNSHNGPPYTCHIEFYPIGGSVALIGFTPEERDTVYISRYAPNTGFVSPLSHDMLDTSLTYVRNDTAFAFSSRAVWLVDSFDYRISVPAVGASYSISGITYTPPPSVYTSNSPCRRQTHFPWGPDVAVINGQTSYSYRPWGANHYFFLHR